MLFIMEFIIVSKKGFIIRLANCFIKEFDENFIKHFVNYFIIHITLNQLSKTSFINSFITRGAANQFKYSNFDLIISYIIKIVRQNFYLTS